MTKATLTLDGLPPLDGTAEAGGDYIRFRTEAGVDAEGLDRLHKGEIEIDGKTERVMVKNIQPQDRDFAGTGGATPLEVTLQRFQPSSV
ncbi:hypothetical protein [Paracoccus fontiphilus]|uniref:Uncharacterized protein n=1 Tax=Paracoccus fontiphilus TaxID=1815556 RepID=A0ABV7ICP4_9RHOB|nr:hypothetical protein [Paracoccus fontiphilus]